YAIPFGVNDIQNSGNVQVSLKIYNILGAEVATLVNEIKQPGRYEVKFNGKNLASGVYLYRLQAGNYVTIKKLTLLK
ncbi:MAG: T9SS type A sorting domain-containing protein, partial [Ignavibacteria bacterium]|nr:T9SS type A sorting domain-containing protein [Ignavibacteria bacterium]